MGKGAWGPNGGPQGPRGHPYGSAPKIRSIPDRFDPTPTPDTPHQAQPNFPKNGKSPSAGFRRKTDIPKTLRTRLDASVGSPKVDTDRYGKFDRVWMPEMPSQANFNFSEIPLFRAQFPQPGPASPRQVPIPKVSVVGRVCIFCLTDTKETWPCFDVLYLRIFPDLNHFCRGIAGWGM